MSEPRGRGRTDRLRSTRSRRCLLPGRAFFRSKSDRVLLNPSPVTEEPPVATLVSDDDDVVLPSMAISPAGLAGLLHAPDTSSSNNANNQWNSGGSPPRPQPSYRAPYSRDTHVVERPSVERNTGATTTMRGVRTHQSPVGMVEQRRGPGAHKKNNTRSFSERRLRVPASWNPDRVTAEQHTRKKAPPPSSLPESPEDYPTNPATQEGSVCNSTISSLHGGSSSICYSSGNRNNRGLPVPRAPGGALTIEVAPGQYLPLRGAVETTRAIQSDYFQVFECWGCTPHLDPVFVIQDANYAICPRCDAVTPVDKAGGSSNSNKDDMYGQSVGIGFTFETLKDVRRGVC